MPLLCEGQGVFYRERDKYVEYNVAQDREALQEMTKLSGGRSVPVITVDDEVMIGFNQDKLDKLLAGGGQD